MTTTISRDGVSIVLEGADEAAWLAANSPLTSNAKPRPSANAVVARLKAAGKFSAFATRLAQNPDALVALLLQGGEVIDTPAVRAILTAAGADPDAVLAG